ncbi:coproporphyrinogen III oxidase [Marivivens donghaensis]|uniref:Heme chaperone HemW n=1 Tax=Marivivens donghaensis TaxID=1699413 RepID=A0ABX0VUJ0_9RHOB|nr:coproporphyrinogen III oxidase [Marivivens donghaensis]
MRSPSSCRAALLEDWQHGGFGLYIHWPFCQSKCPYCDFNSHVASSIDQNRWARAYLSEIDRVGTLTQGRVLKSVFFGGGTPSLMDPELVDAIMTKIRRTWPMTNSAEVTLEANPTSVEAGRFRGYRDAGVNRVSMGIQSLNNQDLHALGRLHSVEEALAAFDIARGVFDRVSFDLIYARQNQTTQEWRNELKQALSLAVDHISMYQLTIEQGTAFGDRYAIGKLRGLPDEDSAADMYDVTQDVAAQMGFPAYEVSNHAPEGAESQHNLIYWRYGDYAGIGPGAHGRLTLGGQKYATETYRMPNTWLEAVEQRGNGENVSDTLNQIDQLHEFLLMGLRVADGVDLNRLSHFGGDALQPNISRLENMGFLTHEKGRLRLTSEGRPLLNAVLRELLVN